MADLLVYEPNRVLGRLLKTRKVSPVELLDQFLERIDRLNPGLNAYITVTAESAKRAARVFEKEIMQGRYRGPLHGIPVSVKDMFATRGVRTTAGSKILSEWVPDFDATAVHRLQRAGAVLLGKTNMHEFAYGVTNDNPHYGPVRNPWDTKRVPGGSSGGSAAAVAAGMCAASLGSDTGGSIRIPSACCGTVGLKPTYGRVSRYGAIPLSWTLDHVGPIARSVEDAAILLQALAGPDANDSTASATLPPDYGKDLEKGIAGMCIGVPENYFFEHVDPEIERAVRSASSELERLGARLVPVRVAHLESCAAMEAHITLAEATSYHEPHMRARAYDYGDRVRVNLEAGRYLLATDYVKSQRARSLLQQAFADAFKKTDVLLTPVLPAFPPVIGEVYVQSGAMREHVVDAFLRFNIPFNLTGLPAISVPCGFSSAGLPIGIQIAGMAFDEATVLRVAYAYHATISPHLRPVDVASFPSPVR